MSSGKPLNFHDLPQVELSYGPAAGNIGSIENGDELAILTFRGDVVTSTIAHLDQRLDDLTGRLSDNGNVQFDLTALEQFDTAGGWLINRLKRDLEARQCRVFLSGLTDELRVLLDVVATGTMARTPPPGAISRHGFTGMLEGLGRFTGMIFADIRYAIDLFGAVLVALARVARHPSRLRVTSVVHHMDRTGLRAVPIILVMAFLIGVIVAQQSAFQLHQFGADLFVVDLVGILVLREMGVLITAVMLAGRSGSAFTAEIGSMRMREEIDAMQVIGLDPIEVLVLPRIIALILILPLLTFIADVAAILGGALVSNLYSGISWDVFVERLQTGMGTGTIVLGFIKAPFMAMVIGIIGCAEGLRVAGSAESLGSRTTSSVVKSLFAVVILDGVFAVFFTAVGI